MKLTSTLLGYLQRPFNRDAGERLALRFQYAGGGNWQVADGILTTTTPGGIGNLTIDLSLYTLAGLADYLAAQPGYSVPFEDPTFGSLSALSIIDGDRVFGASNGDHVIIYTSVLWSLMEAFAAALTEAQAAIVQMLRQMVTTTAQGEWLDVWGGFFAVDRALGQSDDDYRPRITTEPIRYLNNNKAIEQLLLDRVGAAFSIVDLPWRDANDRAFLATLGITTFAAGSFPTGGYPFYGPAINDNPLVCAFGVLLNDGLPQSTLDEIKRLVNFSKAAGTIPLYFAPSGLLHTWSPATPGEVLNNTTWVCGPLASAYQQIAI